ncbi:MAG: sugar phosphate isomerase/epimerase [Gammaproteobacteria bacterium]|nr:sugar phosphate isomerase/epimerase [Gammaproteobacteria bacterium]
MRLSLCNEVIREMDFQEQCRFARSLGYQGLEVAPFTLTADPQRLTTGEVKELVRIAEGEGIAITGLHWLLLAPEGLSITSRDKGVLERTRSHLIRLVHLCAELGGTVLVHGSPQQRSIEPDDSWKMAYDRALGLFTTVANAAGEAGVTYCLEPLSKAETPFINTLEEAVSMVDDIDSSSFRTMIDTSAAGQMEKQSVAELIHRWMPAGKLAHIQFNDTNRRGPGQGDDDFLPVLQALEATGYDGVIAMEPFIYEPDGPSTAEQSIRYVRSLMDQLS